MHVRRLGGQNIELHKGADGGPGGGDAVTILLAFLANICRIRPGVLTALTARPLKRVRDPLICMIKDRQS